MPGCVRFENFGQDFFRGLHKALGPARLLGFEAVHIHRKLGSALDLGEVQKFPALELRAIGKIGVFGERVVFPAAGIVNGFAAPDAGGAVEIEEGAAAGTRTVLDDEMAVEENCFHVGQQGIVAVEIRPSCLRHADLAAVLGIHEIRNGAAKKIGLGEEVGVEDSDEFALGGFQAIFQGARFVAFAVGAVDVNDGDTLCGVALDASASDFAGLVGGVVQHLHVEQFPRVVEA